MLMKVYLTKVSHKHGTDVFCAATSEGRVKQMADYCREWWEDLDWGDNVDAPNLPVSDIDVIKGYWSTVEAAQETCGGQDEDYEEFEYWIEVPLLNELVEELREMTVELEGSTLNDLPSVKRAWALLQRIEKSQPKD